MIVDSDPINVAWRATASHKGTLIQAHFIQRASSGYDIIKAPDGNVFDEAIIEPGSQIPEDGVCLEMTGEIYAALRAYFNGESYSAGRPPEVEKIELEPLLPCGCDGTSTYCDICDPPMGFGYGDGIDHDDRDCKEECCEDHYWGESYGPAVAVTSTPVGVTSVQELNDMTEIAVGKAAEVRVLREWLEAERARNANPEGKP